MDTPRNGIIFCDIDGTTVPFGSTYPEPALLETIARASDNGWLFCIMTGRILPSARRVFAPVADRMLFSCSSGSSLYSDDKPVGPSLTIDRTQAEALRGFSLAHGASLIYSTEWSLYAEGPLDPDITDLFAHQMTPPRPVRGLDEVPDPLVCLTIQLPSSGFPLDACARKAAGTLHFGNSGGKLVDVAPSSKGEEVRRITARLGVPAGNCWAFGDSENDASMLREVGHPYAMKDGSASLLARFPACGDILSTLRAVTGSPATP